jgi:histone H3/H4
MGQPEEKEDLNYAGDAMDYVGEISDELYDDWLTLATDHALSAKRKTVLLEDFQATLDSAFQKLRREKAA